MKLALPVLALLMLQAAPATPTYAQSAKASNENEVKAQIILNLPLVANWPPHVTPTDGKIRLCTLSESAVSPYLRAMATQSSYAGHVALVPEVPMPQVRECHVLLLDGTDSARTHEALQRVAGAPVLTVGTSKDFVQRGGMIGFLSTQKNIGLFSQKNVRFEVNLRHTSAAGIALDPLLLELAENIIPEGAP